MNNNYYCTFHFIFISLLSVLFNLFIYFTAWRTNSVLQAEPPAPCFGIVLWCPMWPPPGLSPLQTNSGPSCPCPLLSIWTWLGSCPRGSGVLILAGKCDVLLRCVQGVWHPMFHSAWCHPLSTPDNLQHIGAGFARLAGSPAFARVVGSIDGCHVRIKPIGADAQDYFNRKLFHSIQLQAVCDHECQFLDIFVGYPGSVHDSRVLKNSPLYVQSLYQPEGYCILGDGGYPCMSWPFFLFYFLL